MNAAVERTRRKVVEVLRTPVMLGWMLLAYGIFATGLGLVVNEIAGINSNQQADRDKNQSEEIYEAQFRAYEISLIAYGDCLSIVKGRDDHRFQWLDFYSELKSELGGSEETAAFIDRLVVKLDENLPPLDPDTTCTKPGQPPEPPPGTDAQPLPITTVTSGD